VTPGVTFNNSTCCSNYI